MKQVIVKLRQRLRHMQHTLQHAEHGAHCIYLGTVGIFAHGPYAYAAIVLLVIVVLDLIAGGTE